MLHAAGRPARRYNTFMRRPASRASPRKTPPAPPPRPDPATLNLVVYPNPKLKGLAREVVQFDPWLAAVVQRMIDLMIEHKGVGLAAPQVGLSLRIFVTSPTGKREDARAFINPVLTDEHGSEEGEEGCLSLPDIRINVPRFQSLRVQAVNEHGQPFSEILADFAARVLQHENDHLDGILLLDRMSPMARLANRKKIRELEEDYARPENG
jgi:peptide deformylase